MGEMSNATGRILSRLTALREQEATALAANADWRPEVRDQRNLEVRQKFGGEINELLKKVGDSRQAVVGGRVFATREAALRSATFDSDPTKHATQWSAYAGRMARVNEIELLEHARTARAEKSLAKAAVLLEEINSRQNISRDRRQEIDDTLRGIPSGHEKLVEIFNEIENQSRQALLAAGHGSGLDQIKLGLRQHGMDRTGASTRHDE
jgi:hypothetical protein